LVEFDPLVSIGSATGGAGGGIITEQIHLAGVLSKAITIPPATAGTPGQTWSLEAFYNLTANETVTNLPPDPFTGQEGVSATFSLAGTIAEILAPVAPTTGATWVFKGNFAEQGTLNGVIGLPDPTTGNQTGIFQCQNNLGEKLTVGSNGAQGGSTGGAPGSNTWQVQVVLNSQVNLMDTLPPGGGATTASFWQQDQATECLMQVIPFHPPSPCITIDAVFTTWGSVTDIALILPNAFTSEVDTGTTQYTDQLTETILMPDGSTQTLMQTSQNNGTFFEISDWS
jgi:hypothetical protein